MKEALKWLLGVVIAFLTLQAFLVPDSIAPPGQPQFPHPELARIIFFHLPCALACTLFFYYGAHLSYKALRTRQATWDVRSCAANEVGLLLAILTMITGMIFARTQWGQFWSWDPRQTSFLFVLLLYGAYFVLRNAIADLERRASIAAAYALFCVIPASFCIFVLPRIMFSLHPSDTIISGKLDANYRPVFYSLFFTLTILCSWIYRLSVRAGLLELKVGNQYGNLEDRSGHSAATGVVRSIPLSETSRTPD
jgi:heme exporter protein C